MIRNAMLGRGRIGAVHAANIAAHPRAALAAAQDIDGVSVAEGRAVTVSEML